MKESEGVKTKVENNNVWNIPERCTKSCVEAYETYWIWNDETNDETDKPRKCPHYIGSYFVERLTKAFNKEMDLDHTKCIEFSRELCDLFKKDESDWK